MRGVLLCSESNQKSLTLSLIQCNIEKLVIAGITEILIIGGKKQCQRIIQQFGNGLKFGCNLTYKIQEKNNKILDAIYLAKDWARDDNITVVLNNNISNINLKPYILWHDFEGAIIFLEKINSQPLYGVAEFYKKLSMKNNQVKITSIIKKSKESNSEFAVTGYYIFDKTVFNRIEYLKYNNNGETELINLNLSYLNDDKLDGYII